MRSQEPGLRPRGSSIRSQPSCSGGAPVPAADATGVMLRARLRTELLRIGDQAGSLTEPDIILDCGASGPVLFEVKLGDRNDREPPGHPGWSIHLGRTSAFHDPEQIRDTRLYQLARNWRAGWELAGDRPLTLVNLAPASLFRLDAPDLGRFEAGLSRSDLRQFARLTWPALLAAAAPLPDWMRRYARQRGLL